MSNLQTRQVSEDELQCFIGSYPRPLDRHCITHSEQIVYIDETLGEYPSSIVAGYNPENKPNVKNIFEQAADSCFLVVRE